MRRKSALLGPAGLHNPQSSLPAGFVHVDLDGLWTLAGCYGFPEDDSFTHDPVFERALPRLLALLDERGVKATFFIVGRDLEAPEKAAAIREIAGRGHELANHSWSHRFGLEEAEEDERETEIERTSAAIAALCGQRPAGFRAPGYAAGPRVLTTCSRCGIRYDGSRLPTRAAPLLRLMAGRLRARVRRELGAAGAATGTAGEMARGVERQYGGSGGLRPEWFRPAEGGAPVLQLPLAVSPVLRLPLHASLGQVLGAGFVRSGLRRLAGRGGPVTFLLHGLDLLGSEDLAGRLPAALAATRPFQAPLAGKLEFLKQTLDALSAVTAVRLTREWLDHEGFLPGFS